MDMEENSETSYCDKESWDEWGSRSSLGQPEELSALSGGREEVGALRAERDALARALAAERRGAAAAARAHDARLAELHGVIAELVRRRAADRRAGAIPEEDGSDEGGSTTQPAGELDEAEEESPTDRNDNSSLASPSELPTPQEPAAGQLTTTQGPAVEQLPDDTDTSLTDLPRCCGPPRAAASRPRSPPGLLPPSPGRCESREAKIASRVRLRRMEDTGCERNADEAWCVEAAEKLALDVCAQADLREALVAASNDGVAGAVWRARCARLAADCRVLDCALARALDTAQRLSRACAVQESSSVALCGALRAADRALETYDVLLALAETRPPAPVADDQRTAAETVARRLLSRLEAAPTWGEPLLSPGPWHNHHQGGEADDELPAWDGGCEERLREHAARLKRETAGLRALRAPPQLYSPHDADDEEGGAEADGGGGAAEMEAAVMMQEILVARETRATEKAAALLRDRQDVKVGGGGTGGGGGGTARRRRRHWLEPRASETEL